MSLSCLSLAYMLSFVYMSSVLAFNEAGLLPEGDYSLTLDQLRKSMLVAGPDPKNDSWDVEWREHLVDNLAIIVRQLWEVGITEIYVDGSFAEARAHPNDIDVYFECDLKYLASGELEKRLNEIDPAKSWTWDDERRQHDENTGKGQLPMWWAYRIEAWPDYGQGSTVIHPITKMEMTHRELFRISRSGGTPKGIIKIVRE